MPRRLAAQASRLIVRQQRMYLYRHQCHVVQGTTASENVGKGPQVSPPHWQCMVMQLSIDVVQAVLAVL
jgi:hypothetical protein